MTATWALTSLFILLATHWFADFFCQSDWMANEKSKDFFALSMHVLVYTLVMSVALYFLFPAEWMLIVMAITYFSHFFTDMITSRITSWLSKRNHKHWFFVMIGFDQLIHHGVLVCLLMLIA